MARFNLHRKFTLKNEVDGIWHDLEEEEDNYNPQTISMLECQSLRKVLGRNGNLAGLPQACKLVSTSYTQTTFDSHASDLGKVNLMECKGLRSHLDTIVGGKTFLPSSCVGMLARDDAHEKETREAMIRRRELKRIPTYVAQHDYPPTAC